MPGLALKTAPDNVEWQVRKRSRPVTLAPRAHARTVLRPLACQGLAAPLVSVCTVELGIPAITRLWSQCASNQ